MAASEESTWEIMRLPEVAVEDFLAADDPLRYGLASAVGDEGDLTVIAQSKMLFDCDETEFERVASEAARLFRRAESHMTDRLGPGQSVVIDEATWTPGGLPAPVLAAACCSMSLVTAWALPDGAGWCVLEVHQEDRELPVMLLLHSTPA
ncbi:MAG: hypothetical protein ACJA2W_001210 [Planctomycetota bacterium]|jgi:hypothetical protein